MTWFLVAHFHIVYLTINGSVSLYDLQECSCMQIKLLNEIEKQKVSNLFKVIADPTRIDILYTLKDSRLSVSEIKDKLNMSQSAISHQLRVLKDVNLVKDERVGKNIFYSLSDNHVYDIFNQAIDHVREEECNHE